MSVRKYVYSRGDACHTKDCKATHYLQIPDDEHTRAVLAEAKAASNESDSETWWKCKDSLRALLSLFEETP